MTMEVLISQVALFVVLALLDLAFFRRAPLRVEARKGVLFVAPFVGLVAVFCILLFVAHGEGWIASREWIAPRDATARSGLDAVLSFLTALALATAILAANETALEASFARFSVSERRRRTFLRTSIGFALFARFVVAVLIFAYFRDASSLVPVAGATLCLASMRMFYGGHARWAKVHPHTADAEDGVAKSGRRALDLLFSAAVERRHVPSSLSSFVLWLAGLEIFAAIVAVVAVVAETTDLFSMIAAQIFAVFAVRSLHGPWVALCERHRFLETSLALALAFMGVKLFVALHFATSPVLSFAMVAGIFMVGVMASLIGGPRDLMLLVPHLDEDLAPFVHAARRTVRRAFIFAAGATLLVVGAALLFLPGPGLPTMIAGLALLATEFVWARRWMKRLLDRVRHMRDSAAEFFRKERGSRE